MCSNQYLQNENPKRKALELITNIFRKKSKEASKENIEEENFPPLNTSLPSVPTVNLVHSRSMRSPLPISVQFQMTNCKSQDYGIPPHSPVSPRVKNIDEDMEALTLSRGDNPFLSSKLEKLSSCGEVFQSNLTINIFPDGEQSLITMDEESSQDTNVHQHLIRSPPPQFPQKLSHFIFPPSLSPSYSNVPINSNSISLVKPSQFSMGRNIDRSGMKTNESNVNIDKINWNDTRCECSLSSSREALLTAIPQSD